MTETNITADMRSVIGKEFDRATSFPISHSDIRRWVMAVYYPESPPEKFWRPDAGSGLTAPEEFNPFAWMSTSGPPDTADAEAGNDANRQFTLLGVEGPELNYQVNGGMSVTYGIPMRTGDVITSSSSIAELTERSGRLGLMLFTTIEAVWTNQNDDEVKRQRMTIIRY